MKQLFGELMALGFLMATACTQAAPAPTATNSPAPDPTTTVAVVSPLPVPTLTSTPVPTSTSEPKGPLDPVQFGIESGIYIGEQTLAITSPDGASIRYTLDGSEPTATSSALYAGPIAVNGRKTIVKAMALRDGWLDSEVREETYKVFSQRVVVSDPVILEGDAVLEIVDTHYVIGNDIILRDSAKLLIRNSLIEHRIEFNMQYGLGAFGSSQVVFHDSEMQTSCTGSLNWNYFEQSSLDARNVSFPTCNTWSLFAGDAQGTIENWDYFGGTVCDTAQVDITKSMDMEIELCWPEGAIVDETLPRDIKEFSFPNADDVGIPWSLHITDSSIDGWGIGFVPGMNVTIRDAPGVTVSIIVGFPWQDQTVVLDGLDRKLYEDTTFEAVDARLRLINTRTYGWEANVWGGNTLIVRNSNFSGATLNGGDSIEIIENSVLDLVRGHENVEITVRNSTIRGDVIATQNSHIVIIDSVITPEFGGDIFVTGNGKVTLINTEFEGEIVTRDNGVVEVQEAE